MYLEHFQLSSEPFSLTPDPAFLYKSEIHTEALAALKLGLLERRGLIAMVGEVGTGKTTLLYTLLSSLGPRIRTAYVSNTKLSFDGLLRSALKDFGCKSDGATRLDLLEELNDFLLDCDRQGHTAALIVDEAQNLSDDAFEELRLLSNYETYKRKLLQIVLVGQPELDAKLRNPAIRQVAERVAVRAHVNPLAKTEALAYIEHRLASVGGTSEIFTTGALNLIAKRSQGIPRRINVLCHNAMLFAYGRNLVEIDKALVVTAMRERAGTGLVRFDRGFLSAGIGNSRFAESLRSTGLGWALAGLFVGISGAYLYLTNFAANESARTQQVPSRQGAAVVSPLDKAEPVAAKPQPATPKHTTVSGAFAAVAVPANDVENGIIRAVEPEPEPVPEPAASQEAAVQPEAAVVPPVVPAPAAQVAPGGLQRIAMRTEPVPTTPEIDTTEALDAPVVAPPVPHPGGIVTVPGGTTLIEMVLAIYGDYSADILKTIRTANPQITDPDLIVAGDRFNFPKISGTARTTQGSVDE